MSDTATMHIDGASRGNPGPASYAVVLARPGMPVVEEADTIGTTTNNVAEYTALVEGLALAAELGVTKLDVFSDSELLVKQMSGAYKVKHEDLRPLYVEACRLRAQFERVTISHVRREQNKRADALGNDALDGKPRKRGGRFFRRAGARRRGPVPRGRGPPLGRERRDRPPAGGRVGAVVVAPRRGRIAQEEEGELTCRTSCSSAKSPTRAPRSSAGRV